VYWFFSSLRVSNDLATLRNYKILMDPLKLWVYDDVRGEGGVYVVICCCLTFSTFFGWTCIWWQCSGARSRGPQTWVLRLFLPHLANLYGKLEMMNVDCFRRRECFGLVVDLILHSLCFVIFVSRISIIVLYRYLICGSSFCKPMLFSDRLLYFDSRFFRFSKLCLGTSIAIIGVFNFL
jgi:hypothetical protein